MSDAPRPQARPVLSAAALAAVRPDAAPSVRLQAARGEAGLAPADRLAAIAVLAADQDPAVRQAARERLAKGPVAPLLEGLSPETDPRILDILARARAADPSVADALLRHPAVPDTALDRLAAGAPGRLAAAVQDRTVPRLHRTRIAQAMRRAAVSDAPKGLGGGNLRGEAGAPKGSDAGSTPANTPDAPRPLGGGSLGGAGRAQPPPPDAPVGSPTNAQRLPATPDLTASPAADHGTPAAAELPDSIDDLEAELDRQEFDSLLVEELDEHLPGAAEKRENIYKTVLGMSVSQKVQLAFKGNKEARGLLVKDSNKLVCGAVMKSPKLSETEVVAYAQSRSVSAEVFRAIARNADYAKLYPIRAALAANPRVPLDIALHCLSSLHENDIVALAKNRNISTAVQGAARRIVQAKLDKERQRQQQLLGEGH